MDWLTENIGTMSASLILLAMVFGIMVKLMKDKKAGKSTCGCNCAHCAMAGKCHSSK